MIRCCVHDIDTRVAQQYTPMEQRSHPCKAETWQKLREAMKEELRVAEEKENISPGLGEMDLHNAFGCAEYVVVEDGAWKYCPQSWYHPLHPFHSHPWWQNCYCS